MQITNPFTGEKRMAGESNPKTLYEERRKRGLAQKHADDKARTDFGEPHPYTGELQTRPRSVGRVYDIPPEDGTYTPDQVDPTGADSVDINKLMEKYDPAGKAFAKAITQGITTDAGMAYDDFTDAKTLQEALDISIHAQQQFAMLPANLRNRFENNPINFLNFVNDEKTLDEQYNLGIRVRPVEPPKAATLDDVVTAVRETAKTKKTPSKGVESDD